MSNMKTVIKYIFGGISGFLFIMSIFNFFDTATSCSITTLDCDYNMLGSIYMLLAAFAFYIIAVSIEVMDRLNSK